MCSLKLIAWNQLLRGLVSVLRKVWASLRPRPSAVVATSAKHWSLRYSSACVVTSNPMSMTWPLIHWRYKCWPLLALEDALDANSMPDPLYSRLSSARRRRKVINEHIINQCARALGGRRADNFGTEHTHRHAETPHHRRIQLTWTGMCSMLISLK